jgi:hypothetical protein
MTAITPFRPGANNPGRKVQKAKQTSAGCSSQPHAVKQEFPMQVKTSICVLALASAAVLGVAMSTQSAQAVSVDQVARAAVNSNLAFPNKGGGGKGSSFKSSSSYNSYSSYKSYNSYSSYKSYNSYSSYNSYKSYNSYSSYKSYNSYSSYKSYNSYSSYSSYGSYGSYHSYSTYGCYSPWACYGSYGQMGGGEGPQVQ